ncbi:MAG: 23S rRNA (pseudouridine(1915)-N(3))-methyltransferase RlmH [bacterium]
MFNITILSIGRIKEKYFADAYSEYLKRLQPYAKIKVEELKAESFSENKASQDLAKKVEGERLINFLNKSNDSRIILLQENGREYSSIQLAELLKKEKKRIIFVIAGALGFSNEIKNKYTESLSLSQMTFPHELARVVLSEQLYRSATIVNNKKYHY